jgi:hypothetical protein
MKKLMPVFWIVFILTGLTAAQETVEAVLEKGDVDRFIQTFPVLVEELSELGMKYEKEEGDLMLPETVRASAELQTLLKKNGWDETFWAKMQAIMIGYSSLLYQKESAASGDEMAKAIKQLESDPSVPESMKKQMIERLKATQKMMGGGQDAYKMSVHEDDLNLIKPKIEALTKLFESLD